MEENQNHLDKLKDIFANVNDWLKFAEAKNFGLLALIGAIVFGFTQINFEGNQDIRTVGYYVLIPFSFLSFVQCLIPLFPILAKIDRKNKKGNETLVKRLVTKLSEKIDEEKVFENIHYFGYLRTIDESVLEKKMIKKTKVDAKFTEYEKELAIQIIYNSRITWLKYQFFKIGAFLFLVGLLVSFGTVVIWRVGSLLGL